MKLFKKLCISFLATAVIAFSTMFMGVKADAAVILKLGSSGQQVMELQYDLKKLGYFNYSKATGYYGIVTRDSVIRFQSSNNLYVDGIAGPRTLAKIDELLAENDLSTYVVQAGDSIWKISLKFGTTVDRIKDLNGLSGDTVYIGQVLKVDSVGTNSVPASTTISESQNTDLYWLARIIHAEAEAEPYLGKVAVGNVIINRKLSPDFPDTIKDVIFDNYKGIPQFSPVAEGTIYNNPSSDSVRAAQEALNGSRPVGSATYFFNPDKSAGSWIVANKIYVTRIGNHVFYK